MTYTPMEKVTCPLCGKAMGFVPDGLEPGSDELGQSLYKLALAHRKSCGGVRKMSKEGTKRAKKVQQEEAPAPEVKPEVAETNADVIVAQALEAKSEEQRGDSEEQTAMEALAGVAPRKGRLQKGDYPVWLQKINAQRLEARNARLAEKAAAKEAKKAAKA